MKLKHLPAFAIFLMFFLGFQCTLNAQYTMENNLVTDCEGTLSDSEEGPQDGQYDHNEDFTFTICVEGAEAITAIFDFFATEDVYDILTVYDGPDTNSPIIAELTGVITNPPILVANSGCMTFHFISDDNIVATGWLLEWFVEVEEFADPELTITSDLDCPLGALDFTIDPRIPCDVIVPGNFQLLGPDGAGIASATPLDCDGDNTASMFTLVFDDSLSLSGNYNIIFNGFIVNSCGDTLFFESLIDFELSDCPFEVQIVLLEQSCPGDCGEVQVEIYSSDNGPFNIIWSHTTNNNEIVDICTDSLTMIEVLVENTSTGVTADDQFWYEPLPIPEILNPFLSDTFCSNNGDHVFNTDITGGIWNSGVMDNNDDRRYRFYRWRWSNGIQQDNITYTDPNGCVAHDTVFVIPINAGLDQAVCVSQGTLELTGNNPNTGIWEGPNTTEDGIFTTTVADTFFVSFTNDEGCTDWKRIFVIDNIEFSDIDTICSNTEIDLRDYVNSLGGVWSGPGVTNWYVGRLKAWQANINAWNTYYYEMEGCIDSLEIYVQGIWAGHDQTVCLSTDTIQLRFAGEWIGPGIYNPIDSTYDISGLGPGEYDIYGRKSGCQDRFVLTIHDVNLNIEGADIYCHDAAPIPIREVVNSNPWDGTFSGEAVVDVFGEIYFDPSLALTNQTYIYFNTLGCSDSVLIEIEQPLLLDDYVFCELGSLQNLDNQGNSGYWQGTGILIPETGLINPAELTIGNNEVFFISDLGCATSVSIELVGFAEAEINNIAESYCFQDTSYQLDLAPTFGTFMINGVVSDPEINPSELGFGYHELEYTVGSGECEDNISVFIAISDEISGSTYALLDTLCPDETTTIFVETLGGNGDVSAVWNQGLGFGKSHTISPNQSTIFNVTLSDGCSDDVDLTLNIHVIDTFEVGVFYGPEVCYGDSSFIELDIDQPEIYEITWDGVISTDGHILNDLPGSFEVDIINVETGCRQEYTMEVPGADPLGAGFDYIPNQECIDLINNEISLVDLAFGYTEGFVNFGIDEQNVDLLTDDLRYEYNDIGIFEITQVVFNELGCTDTLVREICVDNVVRLYVPNIFSPNGDDINDLFTVHGVGVENFYMRIYDRWGNQLYNSTNINESWDGNYRGQQVKQGVYAIIVQYEDQETGKAYEEHFDVTIMR